MGQRFTANCFCDEFRQYFINIFISSGYDKLFKYLTGGNFFSFFDFINIVLTILGEVLHNLGGPTGSDGGDLAEILA